MRPTTLLRTLLALKQTRVTAVDFTAFGIDIAVAPTTRVPYCSVCLRRAKRVYDRRGPPMATPRLPGMEVTLTYEQRRVDCRSCGEVRVELVPWADPGSRFTRDFEDQVAYMA